MTIKKSVAFVFVLLSAVCYSQSGFLGKLNFVELKVRSVPSYKHLNFIDGDDAVRRLRYLNSNYDISVSRVLERNFEISVGYEFARIRCMTDYYLFESVDTSYQPGGNFYTNQMYQNYLDDPEMIYHGGSFSLCFYRLGSIAPIGKYIGFSVNYGIASFKEGETISVGKRGMLEKDGFFRSVGPIGDIDTYNLPDDRKYRAFSLKVKMGRNYPVTESLMINCGMSFPLFSSVRAGGLGGVNYSVWNLEKAYTLTPETTWAAFAANSVRYYNRISIEAGLRYHF